MQPACTLPDPSSELHLPSRFIKVGEPVPAANHHGSSPGRVLLETDRFRPMSEKPLCFGVPLRNLGIKFRGKRFAAVAKRAVLLRLGKRRQRLLGMIQGKSSSLSGTISPLSSMNTIL